MVMYRLGNVHCLGLVVQLWGYVSFMCIDEGFGITFVRLLNPLEMCVAFVYYRW